MKNLSVGKKILVGFLAVILMIAVMLALTVVTSLTRNSDLERVNNMNDLQQESNNLLEEFLLARVEIRTLFTSIDTEEAYTLAKQYLTTAEARLDKMQALSEELWGPQGAESIVNLRAMFADMNTGIDAVYGNDALASEALEHMTENGTVMMNEAGRLFELVTGLTQSLAAEDPAGAIARLNSVIIPAKDIGDLVDSIRIQSRAVLYDQDLTAIPEIFSMIEDLNAQGANLRANLTTDEGRAGVDTVINATAGFKTSIEQVQTVMQASEDAIAAARVTFLDLNDAIAVLVEAIAVEMVALNEASITTSMLVMIIMVVVGIVSVVFSVLVATILGRAITRPLNKMQTVMEQAGKKGNLKFSEEVRGEILKEAQAKDEIGQSLAAFSGFVDHIVHMAELLQQVADKDLTADIELLSGEDTMGLALRDTLDNLNQMFSEINSISSQVATAANEIAMGAQSLAQGSTEQASTVEEISASINEINEQMNTSNETARHSAQKADEINKSAQEGNEKMTHLTGSMHEINEASQNIGNVIKVIDDIAFQTNILALNAAVEAARAGEHGKGFAVVADEVRNLAGKSAAAAKETADLISANIEKTEQGMALTTETAESLTEIMTGIGETNESLQMVAEQAEGAKTATAQVNLAIDQVAQVVQQNSATSEQSAAASQEMSSQAQVLQQLIAQFRLKGAPQTPAGLPGAGGGQAAAEDDDEAKRQDNTIIF